MVMRGMGEGDGKGGFFGFALFCFFGVGFHGVRVTLDMALVGLYI